MIPLSSGISLISILLWLQCPVFVKQYMFSLCMYMCVCIYIHIQACICRLPSWLSGKESTCQYRRCGFNPWVMKIPWRRKWQPTQVFLPGEFHRQKEPGGLQSMGLQRVRHDLVTYTHTHTHTHTHIYIYMPGCTA